MTQDELKSHLAYSQKTGVFTWVRPTSNRVKRGATAGKIAGAGYVYIGLKGRHWLAHRLAWLYVYGKFPEHQIDHINRIRTDNRLSNLRDVPPFGNMQNLSSRGDNTSGIRGVVWRKDLRKWQAQIRIKRKCVWLGVYSTAQEAAAARKAGEVTYHLYGKG